MSHGLAELALLKAFSNKAQAIHIFPEDCNYIATTATEDKQMAREGMVLESSLHQLSQTVALLLIPCNAGNQLDTGA
jgi:hypothetical protein